MWIRRDAETPWDVGQQKYGGIQFARVNESKAKLDDTRESDTPRPRAVLKANEEKRKPPISL